ncbi:DoxX family protein [Herbaspirillum sp. RTI4]|uniref:DoxX family protein n=1 Tax=Herbaspirillum sp. RTI4 TaxID=3048640 RepID=UPI002AB3FDF7|nr:DoxX family protein [Herbaspirillum sp. RTI4]MDY7578908.1 DoxX family protein [Herbaspirillum sp. RTI4]MEA9981997.1 DoxX family protein [Herbaspirillum sp. RTI4]
MTITSPVFRIGRALLGLLFLVAGIGKITGFAGTVGYMGFLGFPMPELVTIVTIVVEVGGALALITGKFARPAALVVALFTVGATLAAHRFWQADPAAAQAQMTNFLKNLSIIGGLLMVWAVKPENK